MSLSKEEQEKYMDAFTADLLVAISNEGLVLGISQPEQEMARTAVTEIGGLTKTMIGRCTPMMFASALITYGQAMIESLRHDAEEADEQEEGGRQVYQHIDESISTKEGDEDE